MRRDVEQLWAEAVYLFRSGHLWHLTGADVELAEAIQSERVEMTEIDSMVADYLAHLSVDSISTRDVLINALNLDPTSSTFAEQAQRLGTKVNSAISSAGWEYLGRKGKHRLTMYSRRIRQG